MIQVQQQLMVVQSQVKCRMFILFPKGKVSEVQRKQMTTFIKSNVSNIAVKGDFDDCQKLIKDFLNLITKQKN